VVVVVSVIDILLGVVVDVATLLDGSDDGGKVVIREHHLGSALGDSGTSTHGDTNVGGLESRRVVDTIAGHGDDLADLVEHVDELLLVDRLDASKEARSLDGTDARLLVHLLELGTREGLAGRILVLTKDANLTANGNGSVLSNEHEMMSNE